MTITQGVSGVNEMKNYKMNFIFEINLKTKYFEFLAFRNPNSDNSEFFAFRTPHS